MGRRGILLPRSPFATTQSFTGIHWQRSSRGTKMHNEMYKRGKNIGVPIRPTWFRKMHPLSMAVERNEQCQEWNRHGEHTLWPGSRSTGPPKQPMGNRWFPVQPREDSHVWLQSLWDTGLRLGRDWGHCFSFVGIDRVDWGHCSKLPSLGLEREKQVGSKASGQHRVHPALGSCFPRPNTSYFVEFSWVWTGFCFLEKRSTLCILSRIPLTVLDFLLVYDSTEMGSTQVGLSQEW